MAFVQLRHTCAGSGRGLICAANAVNTRACFVTAILSADTLITAQVMKERSTPPTNLICHALCVALRPEQD